MLVTCLNDCSHFTYKKKIGNEIHLHNKHQTTLYIILDTAVLPHTSVFKYRYANICRMSSLLNVYDFQLEDSISSIYLHEYVFTRTTF